MTLIKEYFETQLSKIENGQKTIRRSLFKLLEKNNLPGIDLLAKTEDLDILTRPIQFNKNSDAISETESERLKSLASILKNTPNVNVTITGAGDSSTNDSYDLALGERRALEAKKYLINLGINPERLKSISYGEIKPSHGLDVPSQSAILVFSEGDNEKGQM